MKKDAFDLLQPEKVSGNSGHPSEKIQYSKLKLIQMKKLILPLVLLAATLLPGCELIGDIFQAGFYAGILIVVAVVVLLIFIFRKLRG